MRQRYLRLISVLLLLAILTACGTDREGAAGGTVEGVVNRNGDFLVLLTDEGEYQTFEFGAGVDTGALEEGDGGTGSGEMGVPGCPQAVSRLRASSHARTGFMCVTLPTSYMFR